MLVTNQMLGQMLSGDLQTLQGQMLNVQQQLSSGDRILTPSDNPSAAEQIVQLNHAMAQNGEYQNNATQAVNWLTSTSSALSQMVTIGQSVRTLAVSASGDMPQSQIQALQDQTRSLLQSMLSTANTQVGGQYLFAGTLTDSANAPFSLGTTGPTYSGNNHAIQIAIGPTSQVVTNTTGSVLMPLLTATQQIITDLSTGTAASLAQVTGSDLSQLNTALDGVIDAQATAGATQEEVQQQQSQLTSAQNQLTQLKASTQDTNVTQAVVQLQQLQESYQSALAVGANLIEPTLAKYIP